MKIFLPDSADICLVHGSRANVCCQEWSHKPPDPPSCLPKSGMHEMNWNASESWRKETLAIVLRQVVTGAPGTPELGMISWARQAAGLEGDMLLQLISFHRLVLQLSNSPHINMCTRDS